VLERLARFVLRHRKWVVATWLVLLVAGGAAAGQLSKRMVLDFSLPGQPGTKAVHAIEDRYGVTPEDTYIPVVTLPAGQSVVSHKAEVGQWFDAIVTANPTMKVVDYATTGDAGFISKDGRTTYAFLWQPQPTLKDGFDPSKKMLDPLQAAVPTGVYAGLTNSDLISYDKSSGGKGPSVFVELMFGGLGALAILTFVFASFLALIPLVIAAFSILTTFLLLLGLTYLTHVNFVVQFLVGLIGLGVAIDYSLLLVTRWREEKDHGKENHEAIVEAVRTAGHAVVSSAGTVAIGLVALAVLPIPFLRAIGIGGLLIPLVSTLAVLTFLPAVLGGIGPKVDWPKLRHEDTASKFWTRWAGIVVKQRWIAAGVALAALVVMIIPFTSIRVGKPASDAIGQKDGKAYHALQVLRDGGEGTGVLTPMVLLVHGDPSPTVDAVKGITGVRRTFVAPAPTFAHGDDHLVVVEPDNETVAGPSTKVVKRVRTAAAAVPGFGGLAGIGADQLDFIHGVYGNFPLIFGLILLLTFLLLARSFRSILLPLKAVLLNGISLAATYGLVVVFWQHGHGSESLFGIRGTGAITFWVPMMIFAFLFGLSMDYEVFILSRIREEYDKTGSTDAAVVQGIGRTGRLVTSAALVLFLSFVSLAASPGADTKIMATALGAGILLDATVIRAILVPALVSLFGEWNWYMPTWLAKLLRADTSPPAAHSALAD
jgi:RND superfamily putative drug exporter